MKELEFGNNKIGKKQAAILLGGLLAVCLLILSLGSIDAVLAYMFKRTENVTNVLVPAQVSAEVEETFDTKTKSNVSVRNTGNIPVYIRVTLAKYWMNDGVYVPQPDGGAVSIAMGGEGWLESGGVYYYTTPVDVGGSTSVLIESVTAVMPEGYTYHLDVHAEAIQADPASAVTDSWHVTLTGDTITGVAG